MVFLAVIWVNKALPQRLIFILINYSYARTRTSSHDNTVTHLSFALATSGSNSSNSSASSFPRNASWSYETSWSPLSLKCGCSDGASTGISIGGLCSVCARVVTIQNNRTVNTETIVVLTMFEIYVELSLLWDKTVVFRRICQATLLENVSVSLSSIIWEEW